MYYFTRKGTFTTGSWRSEQQNARLAAAAGRVCSLFFGVCFVNFLGKSVEGVAFSGLNEQSDDRNCDLNEMSTTAI